MQPGLVDILAEFWGCSPNVCMERMERPPFASDTARSQNKIQVAYLVYFQQSVNAPLISHMTSPIKFSSRNLNSWGAFWGSSANEKHKHVQVYSILKRRYLFCTSDKVESSSLRFFKLINLFKFDVLTRAFKSEIKVWIHELEKALKSLTRACTFSIHNRTRMKIARKVSVLCFLGLVLASQASEFPANEYEFSIRRDALKEAERVFEGIDINLTEVFPFLCWFIVKFKTVLTP